METSQLKSIMSDVLSKFQPVTSFISTSCVEFYHPWTDSCIEALFGVYIYCIFDSLKIYGTVYGVGTSIFKHLFEL